MRAFAHDVFTYPLPPGHRFPLGKYRLVREGAERLDGLDVAQARSAGREELAGGHEPDYIARIERAASVRTGPAETALTRMLFGPRSQAR